MPVQIVQLLTEPDLLPKFQYLFEKEHGPVPFEVSNILWVHLLQSCIILWSQWCSWKVLTVGNVSCHGDAVIIFDEQLFKPNCRVYCTKLEVSFNMLWGTFNFFFFWPSYVPISGKLFFITIRTLHVCVVIITRTTCMKLENICSLRALFLEDVFVKANRVKEIQSLQNAVETNFQACPSGKLLIPMMYLSKRLSH